MKKWKLLGEREAPDFAETTSVIIERKAFARKWSTEEKTGIRCNLCKTWSLITIAKKSRQVFQCPNCLVKIKFSGDFSMPIWVEPKDESHHRLKTFTKREWFAESPGLFVMVVMVSLFTFAFALAEAATS